MKSISNQLMYIIFGIGLVIIAIIESRDWECSNPYNILEPCKISEGMPYRGSTPIPTDSTSTLLQKIDLASSSEKRSIKWRRSIVMSGIISILSFSLIITPGMLPPWYQLYSTTIIGFAVLYFSFNYFTFHKLNRSKENIKQALDYISKKTV